MCSALVAAHTPVIFGFVLGERVIAIYSGLFGIKIFLKRVLFALLGL